ncbi:cob(I)yrinic acid a,c-diamide adenosyltransferase [Georgenia sp. TF02-10]|uniref:cob(I)yrinic acid a,c-diamide adenosyltransferase n=1 Tax=Georgenia sp. TF02-10 TaxID=2917725 RepID=UPI001FA802CE|nr:cob(I)yrinic acid a,c-diamide adenosyltransferase [Georgenia sp. TF02-10]UNX54873.1 cob(I)yrinic acid a,c-diamide adenosyltransferase [Georgenia sp. TF02-10]
MAKIYTRTGDDGDTGLFLGGRVSKADVLVEGYGDVDETVALLGVARAGAAEPDLAELLLRLQRELFVVGADLATHPDRRHHLTDGVSRVTSEMVLALEELMDRLVSERPLRPVFVVPGTTATSAALDHTRAVARRAERHVVAAREAGHAVSEPVAHYLNRLSDLLFVLARHAAGEVEEPASHD